MAQGVFGAFDAADERGLHANVAGCFDVHEVVVEEEDAGGIAAERADDVLEGDPSEILDQVIAHYNAEKLKEATAVN